MEVYSPSRSDRFISRETVQSDRLPGFALAILVLDSTNREASHYVMFIVCLSVTFCPLGSITYMLQWKHNPAAHPSQSSRPLVSPFVSTPFQATPCLSTGQLPSEVTGNYQKLFIFPP
jgi:TRAP-type uncharacterized transport system fused permease subunit